MPPTFSDLGIVDLLEADPRPSFVVALSPGPPSLVYTNRAFNATTGLLELILSPDDGGSQLWEWITVGLPPGPPDDHSRSAIKYPIGVFVRRRSLDANQSPARLGRGRSERAASTGRTAVRCQRA